MGYIYKIQYCAEELMDGTGGTENCVEGHHGTSLDVPYVLWGLRDGMNRWTENCVEGHHGTSLDVPYVLWGLRDGMDRWDIELC